MKNNNHTTSRHRGSSPPFQTADQGLYEWEIGLKSMYQPSDESPYIQMLDQHEDQEEEWDEPASSGLDRIHPARPSFGEIEMTRIVGKMTGEKAVEHSEAIMIASIQKLIEYFKTLKKKWISDLLKEKECEQTIQ